MAIYTVLNGLDSGIGSLRQAVLDSNSTPGINTINFDPSVSLVTLTSGALNVTNSVTINGHGSSLLEVTRDDAVAGFKIWNYSGNITFVLNGMTISNGRDVGSNGGGGLSSTGTLNDIFFGDDLFFKNCFTRLGIGAAVHIDSGSKTSTFTNLRVEECNTTNGQFYGCAFVDNIGGAGGSVHITNAIFTNNNSNISGAINVGGSLSFVGQNIDIYNNICGSSTHGIRIIGAASADIKNVQIYDETSTFSNSISIFNTASVQLEYITIHNNTNSYGIIINNCPSGTLSNSNIYSIMDTGLIIASNSDITVQDSQIYNINVRINSLRKIGGIELGTGSTLRLFSSSIFNNTAELVGGINVQEGNIAILNSTISGNIATDITGTGGILANDESADIQIYSSTIASNSAPSGIIGGVYEDTGAITVVNTIIANNTGNTANDVLGSFTSLGNNLIGIGDGSTSFINGVNGDQVGTILAPIDPIIAPLSNNGGPTLTMALLPGSPAIDTGNTAFIPPGVDYDQRGTPYFRIVGSSVDIGSYEVQAVICYAGESLVRVKNINTGEIYDMLAQDIVAGKYMVYNVITDEFIPVKYNIKAGTTEKFKLLKKNIISDNKPSRDFYPTGGHMIYVGNAYIKARDICGAVDHILERQIVYSICTEKSVPILINGIGVLTWSEKKWEKYASKNNISWSWQ